jgi:hypothetical protein
MYSVFPTPPWVSPRDRSSIIIYAAAGFDLRKYPDSPSAPPPTATPVSTSPGQVRFRFRHRTLLLFRVLMNVFTGYRIPSVEWLVLGTLKQSSVLFLFRVCKIPGRDSVHRPSQVLPITLGPPPHTHRPTALSISWLAPPYIASAKPR